MNGIGHSFLIRAMFVLGFLLTLVCVQASEVEFDRRVVHYSALNTTFLSPEVARAYDLRRSSRRALVNVVIMKCGGNMQSSPGVVSGHAVNLNRQLRPLRFREVRDGDAFYHLAEVRVPPGLLEFHLRVSVAGDAEVMPVAFSQTFYLH